MEQRLSCQTNVWCVFQQVFHAEPLSCVSFSKSFDPNPCLRHARVLAEALGVAKLRPRHTEMIACAPQRHLETPQGPHDGPAGDRNRPLRIPQHPKILNYRFHFPLATMLITTTWVLKNDFCSATSNPNIVFGERGWHFKHL